MSDGQNNTGLLGSASNPIELARVRDQRIARAIVGTILAAIIIAGSSFYIGRQMRNEISRQQAWNLATEVFKICDERLNPPGAPLQIVLKRSGACHYISEVVLNDIYEARRLK